MRVLRENTAVGVTGTDGRLLVTALRPYERNRIGIEINDLPDGALVVEDALTATPGPRAGTVVRFPVETGAAGDTRIVDETGAPLPVGAILMAEDQRYPVGRDGRVFVGGVHAPKVLRRNAVEPGCLP